MKKVTTLLLAGLLLAACNTTLMKKDSGNAPVITVPSRADIDEQYQWNLADMYADQTAWEADFKMVSDHLEDVAAFKGKVSESAQNLSDYFSLMESLGKKIDKMYVYAGLKKDEDTRISDNQALLTRISALQVAVGEKSSFFETELLTVPESTLNKWFSSEAGLKPYRFYLDNLLRQQTHVLGEKEENLLAMLGNFAETPNKIQEAIKYADMKFPQVKNDKGELVQLTPGRYYQLLLSPDKDVRRRAFEARNGAFNNVINTSAATYNALLQKDLFYTKTRGYNSTLERALSYDNVPVEVFNNLIETVKSNLGPMHRYYALKKKVLGLKEMHLYDTSLPIVPEASSEYPYEKAKGEILDALKPMGEEYVNTVNRAFNERWIDVYETEGKTGGAYSWGTFDAPHPYILLNYNDTQDNMFTLAHELGHTMHSFYSRRTQPYATADYSLFVAEVASTFNENMLMKYMLDRAQTKEEKMILLDQWISNIEGTIITQVQFADFEKQAHAMAQAGEPVTVESLNALYHKLLVEYNGPDMVIDDLYDLTWSRIPHFYRSFYVYKYATALCASTSLFEAVYDGDQQARTRYMNFLKSGGSDYPINELKAAGVDMSRPQPIVDTMNLLNDLVSQLEDLMK